MTNREKIEMLKSAIEQLYTNEGRSKSYIARLLDVDRKMLTNIINNEWNLEKNNSIRHLKPSNEKFLNKNRDLIKSRLDKDVPMTEIAKELGVKDTYLSQTIIVADETLTKALKDKEKRMHDAAEQKRLDEIERKTIIDLPDEEWKEVVGHPSYMISNMGRMKRIYKDSSLGRLLKPSPAGPDGRLYYFFDNKASLIHRLVAFHFVDGYSNENNTVNHIDGDKLNNKASNLEWVSQSENNLHAYRVLNKTVVRGKRFKFDKILYKGKYEFKTVAAFARFLGKSETQTRRYMEEPEKHDIKLIINE